MHDLRSNIVLLSLVGNFLSNQLMPSLASLLNDFGGVFTVLSLAVESKVVLGLAVRDLVDAEPLVGCAKETGEVLLDVFDVVKFGGKGVVDVDGDDLPVSFA